MSTPFTELSGLVNSSAMVTGNDDLQSAMFMPEQHVYYPFGDEKYSLKKRKTKILKERKTKMFTSGVEQIPAIRPF